MASIPSVMASNCNSLLRDSNSSAGGLNPTTFSPGFTQPSRLYTFGQITQDPIPVAQIHK